MNYQYLFITSVTIFTLNPLVQVELNIHIGRYAIYSCRLNQRIYMKWNDKVSYILWFVSERTQKDIFFHFVFFVCSCRRVPAAGNTETENLSTYNLQK